MSLKPASIKPPPLNSLFSKAGQSVPRSHDPRWDRGIPPSSIHKDEFMVMPHKMQAARLYEVGSDMQLEEAAVPDLRPDEVLIKVQACNVVQNLRNVLKGMDESPLAFPFPRLPAVFGLDVTGTVERRGSLASDFEVGDRVYVNPELSCGECEACRSDRSIDCEAFALRGYFGIGPKSQKSLDNHPQGGFAQFMAAPRRNLVRLPDELDFDTASRFGYLGTAFSALQQAGCGPGKTVLIDGITGTLGLGAAAIAVAMGAAKILGTARDTKLFARVKALGADGRIELLELGTAEIKEWASAHTDGEGVDIVIDALGGWSTSGGITERTFDASAWRLPCQHRRDLG